MEKQAFGQKNRQKRHFFGFFALGFELDGQVVGSQGQDFALGGQVVESHWMNMVINSIGVTLATNYSIGFLWPPLVQPDIIICIKADSHLFFTISSETPNEVGMSSVFLDKRYELYLNSFCFRFRLKDFETLLPEYAAYMFRGTLFRKEMLRVAQGTTRYNLSKKSVMKVRIRIPHIEEQQKIA